ncbi:hypothetical protein CMU21_12610 [Elizabethkingia anophelis]|nr:hypothetical protein [Elizabethkingia anophelis]
MSISSNSVIHYTNNIDNLKGIIENNGFKVKYCSENLFLDDYITSVATPMVCFCDIPLSEVKNHIDSYGNYGIGLYKTWAKKSGLNPVLYIESKSETGMQIRKVYERLVKNFSEGKKDLEFSRMIVRIIQFCKNYDGPLKTGKINDEHYRFYDEREWRYIPSINSSPGIPPIINNSQYIKDKDTWNEMLTDVKLAFTVDEISYIIVDSEDEIPEILSLISQTFENTCTAKQLKVLGTKILTKNQIFNDF